MIEIKDACKEFYGERALSNFTMTVNDGSIYGLIGPNGAGKTTILNIICGVYKEDKGSIMIDGQRVYENVDVKNNICYVQDDLFYYNQYSILDMKNVYESQYNNFDSDMYEKLINIFEMDDKKRIKTLSKGMKKQVAIILALSAMPKLLVLDEPLDGLDPINRRKVIKVLLAETTKRNMTVLVSSHNLRELEDICDTVGIINEGHMIFEKKMYEVVDNIIKVQAIFNDDNKIELIKDKLDIRSINFVGKVYNLIIRGEKEEILDVLNKSGASVVDTLPLTLEEIFMYVIEKEEIDIEEYFN